MEPTSAHSNETSKKILFIMFKQFQIARGQNVSGAFLFRSQKTREPPCKNLEGLEVKESSTRRGINDLALSPQEQGQNCPWNHIPHSLIHT